MDEVKREKERKRQYSHQNPDHLADAEVGWKCDEFPIGRRFYPGMGGGSRNQVATGNPVASCATVQTTENLHFYNLEFC